MGRIDRTALDAVYTDYAQDRAFRDLRRGNSPLIRGEGTNPVVFIAGECPGASEAIHRRPYSGRAGIMLRRLMEQANLFTETQVTDNGVVKGNCWLTNVVKYRPPGRFPTIGEYEASAPYLAREWNAVGKPDVIVCVGVSSYHTLTGNNPHGREAGTPQRGHGGRIIWAMFSPTYGINKPAERPAIEQHWKTLGAWLSARNS